MKNSPNRECWVRKGISSLKSAKSKETSIDNTTLTDRLSISSLRNTTKGEYLSIYIKGMLLLGAACLLVYTDAVFQ